MPIEIDGAEYDAYVVEGGELEPYDVQLGDGTIIAEHGPDVPTGGVSRWEFEQDGTDSWGSNDGTLHSSVAYTTDAALGSYAIECNGSDGGFRLSNPFDFIQQTAEFTVNCWVNLNTLSTPNFHSVMGTTHDTTASGFRIMIDDTGTVYFDHAAAGSEGDTTVGSLSAGTYHMLTFTGDGSTGRVYIDGVEQDSFAISTTTNTANADLAVGERPDSLGTRVIDGIIDDPRIYDITLTASEISTLYNEGS